MPFRCNFSGECEETTPRYPGFATREECEANCTESAENKELLYIINSGDLHSVWALAPSDQIQIVRRLWNVSVDEYEITSLMLGLLQHDYTYLLRLEGKSAELDAYLETEFTPTEQLFGHLSEYLFAPTPINYRGTHAFGYVPHLPLIREFMTDFLAHDFDPNEVRDFVVGLEIWFLPSMFEQLLSEDEGVVNSVAELLEKYLPRLREEYRS